MYHTLCVLQVTFKEEHTSFLHFMTSICAIIGGSFSVFCSPQPPALERLQFYSGTYTHLLFIQHLESLLLLFVIIVFIMVLIGSFEMHCSIVIV
jgi:hypothetical protein